MSEPYIGEIKLWALPFAPRGWAFCDGQHLPISQHQALYSLLGTTYGGDGVTTFALPDLRGRVPIHPGGGIGLGQAGGEESHALTIEEMPAHTHAVAASPEGPNSRSVAGSTWAAGNPPETVKPYRPGAPNTVMKDGSLSTTGSSQPHPNMQPYLTLNFCIALQGIYPTRS